MRGSIVKRGGTYSIVISLGRDPTTGKFKQKWLGGFATKREAEVRLTELLREMDTGAFVLPTKRTLGEFLESWLEEYARPNLAPTTVEGYEHIVHQQLAPALGHIALAQLKPEHIQRYLAAKQKDGRQDGKGGLSVQTVRHHSMCLHGALATACKWGLLSRNPADSVTPPRSQAPEWHTLGEDDIQRLLAEAKSTSYFALFHLALFTGLRRSELLALRWADVNLPLCQLYVTRTLHCMAGRQFVYRQPKTAKGRRMVALAPSTALVLADHRRQQQELRAALGAELRDDDLLFADVEGRPLRPDTVTHAWVKIVRRLGLGPVRLHDARHTHASLLLKTGTHPKVVQERLGHSSVQMTIDLYSHIAPGLQEAAAAQFDRLLAAGQSEEGPQKSISKLLAGPGADAQNRD